jgi:NAD(P)-dependent dehydrogenase (short-subunit alcohol dehydrogenase family)
MDLGLTGRRVLITDAPPGIGEGLARAFAEKGCDLHRVARAGDHLAALREALPAAHPAIAVTVQPLDLTETVAINAVMAAAGDVHILVNNAGAIANGNLADVDEARRPEGWELKIFGDINLRRATEARMKAHGGRSPDDGIRAVGVNRGPVDTDHFYAMLKQHAKSWLGDEARCGEFVERYPLKRPATVHEIADLGHFPASDRSADATGTIVTVDDGISSRHSIL